MSRLHLGRELMPWQKYVASRALEVDPETGQLAYREVRLTVPRQSGKTTLLFALLLHRAMQIDTFGRRQQVVYTAQTGKEARKKWELDWVPEVKDSKTLRPTARNGLVIHRATGHEGFTFPKSRSRFSLAATTKKAGHGGTLDLAFLDEAFAQADDRMEQAFKPAMITRRSPQLWIVSTAGDAESLYLKSKVDGGRKLVERGSTHGVAYFEWSAPEEADPEDPATWRACMPALGHTVAETTIRDEFASMRDGKEGVDGFRRAYLNHWVGQRRPLRLDVDAWAGAVADVRPEGLPAFFVTIEKGMRSASIAVAAQHAGRRHVELADHRPGTGWLLERLSELSERHPEAKFGAAAAGPVASMMPELERAEIPVELLSGVEMGRGCGYLEQLLADDLLTHSDDMLFTLALHGAETRDIGEGLWSWDWGKSTADIAPIAGATGALWLLEKYIEVDYDPLESAW